MRKVLQTLLRILDGAPHPTKQNEKGQSLLELAFITPLLAIMVLGIIEIGWFANHYLILLEVTRVGARSGTVLTGDLSPLNWNNVNTIHPVVYDFDNTLTWSDGSYPLGATPPSAINNRSCAPGTEFGFYNFIACSMIDSLDPLVLRGRDPSTTDVVEKNVLGRSGQVVRTVPFPDDIVISLFSVAAVNNESPATVLANRASYSEDRFVNIYSRTYDFGSTYPDGFSLIVTGRYPTNANECNVYYSNPAPSGLDAQVLDASVLDPFDYIQDNVRNTSTVGERLVFIESEGYDEGPEMQRGYVWTGQHKIDPTTQPVSVDPDGRILECWGSEFTDAQVVELMNSPGFLNSDGLTAEEFQERLSFLPSQGLVLVEMYWMHDLLLNFPLISPAVAMFSDVDNIIVHVWAAFPVPSVAPNFTYQLPPS